MTTTPNEVPSTDPLRFSVLTPAVVAALSQYIPRPQKVVVSEGNSKLLKIKQ